MNKSWLLLGLSHVGAAALGASVVYAVIPTAPMGSPAPLPTAPGPPASGVPAPPTPIAVAAPAPGVEKASSKAVASSLPGEASIVSLTGPPRPFFEVWSSKKSSMKPDEQRVFEQVRDALAGNRTIPEHRAGHFSWLKEKGFYVTGWSADLLAAEPIDGGHLVSFRIIPRVGSPSGDGMMQIADWSIERYKVFNDGTWTFVDGTTPPGMGQPAWGME